MQGTSRLANMILSDWREHNPRMVAELTRTDQLMETLRRSEERAVELLYQYLSVQKMDYQSAWELTMQECLSPERSTTVSSRELPATSG